MLKDGASAIYGSDAIAGVINVILKTEYTGFNANASAGTSYKGDGNQYRAGLTYGIGDLSKDKYNVFATFDWYKQDSLKLTERGGYIGSSQLDFIGVNQLGGDPNNPDRLSTNSPLGNVRSVNPTTLGSPGPYQSLGNQAQCEAKGGKWALSVNPSAGYFCNWEVKDWRQIQPENTKMNLLVKGVYQFNTDLQAYGEASWSNNKVETTGTPTAPRSQYVGGDLKPVDTTLFALPVGHPDNPYNAQNLAARLYLTDFAVNSVGRGGDYDSDTYRFVAGLKGTNWDWDWDVGGMYAKTDQDISRYGFYSRTNLEQAIRGQGGFGYYRVGGSSDLNNPGIWGFVSPTLNNSTSTSVTQFDGKMTRQWLNTPGGPLGVAVGAEWRREEIDSPPVPGTDVGDVIGLGYSAANGSRDVWAFYGEANWTLLKTLELDVRAALRRLFRLRQHVEPEGRPALEPDQGSAAPRHLGDRLPRAERVRERQFGDDRVHDLHRPGALPDHRCRPRLRQRPARRGDVGQPADYRRDLRELHPRRRLGADSWHVARTRLLELHGR